MLTNSNIQNELKQIAPQLYAILKENGQLNPFKVPANYFVENAAIIQQVIEGKEVEISDELKSALEANAYILPENYFDNLVEEIIINIKNIEQDEISLSNTYKSTEVFKVPEGYFEGLEAKVFDKIYQADDESFIHDFKEASQTVPADYFKNLEGKVWDKINADKGGRVVEMQPQGEPKQADNVFDIGKWAKRASAAAAVILVFFAVTFLFRNLDGGESFNLDAQLAQLTDQELNTYIASHAEEFDEFAFVGDFQLDDMFEFNNLDSDFIGDYLVDDIDEFLIEEIF